MPNKTSHIALLLALPISIPSATADVHPPGTLIEEAVVVDIPESGFSELTSVLSVLVPPQIELDDVQELSGDCGWLGTYAYGIEVNNLWVDFQIVDSSISPADGYLALDITLSIQINESADRFTLNTHLLCISDGCDAYVEPFEAQVQTTIAIDLVDDGSGGTVVDATVGELVVDYNLESADINLDSCAVGTIEDIFNFFGGSLYDLLLPILDPILQEQVADLGPDIEEAIEDGLNELSIQEELEVEDALIYLDLEPHDIQISNAGLRIIMAGGAESDSTHECIDAFHPGGSLATLSPAPTIGDIPSSISVDPAASVHLADDFVNQVLFGFWEGGLLCYDIDEELTGIPLDTSILGLLAGDAFDPLFPEQSPLWIQTQPKQSPVLNLETARDLAIHVPELGLDFSAELDHRTVRVLTMDLDVDAGIDLAFDNTTGLLGVELDLGSESLAASVAYNELMPNASTDIEANFGSVFETLLGSVLGGLTEDLGFNLPAYEGIGLTSIQIAANGSDGDWLGAYAEVGPVGYGEGGCSEDGSCDSGCEGGCSTPQRARGTMAMWAFPLMLFFFRRRTTTEP